MNPNHFFLHFVHFAEKEGLPATIPRSPIWNLKPLNELETTHLEMPVSPHKTERPEKETPAGVLGRDLVAINEFLHYVEAQPFVPPEKSENRKPVAFKKSETA